MSKLISDKGIITIIKVTSNLYTVYINGKSIDVIREFNNYYVVR